MRPAPLITTGYRRRVALCSLLIGLVALPLAPPPPLRAAELLELRIDSLQIPIHLDQLAGWSRQGGAEGPSVGDLGPWLGLLDARSRADLKRILRAPLLRDQSFGRQLLDTWAGGQLLEELGNLLTTSDGGSTTTLLQITLRRLLEQRREVTLLELLEALPPQTLNLRLDGLVSLGQRWRFQLKRQQLAMVRLGSLPLPRSEPPASAWETAGVGADRPAPPPLRLRLAVPGRREGLPLEIWAASAERRPNQPWVLMMPGLGGNADQLGWLARALAQRGWPVVVVQHPGSDGLALRAALNGQRPPPGAETLGIRLADVEAVVAAQRLGRLPVNGTGLVLAGHSLGGLTALLAAGIAPQPGLEGRCRTALERLPIHNPSRLIQCQLPERALPHPSRPPTDLRALVLFNGFGSLLWPEPSLGALPVPLLMVGGSLDLVTPPLDEQLALFLAVRDPRSRLVLVQGASHFSPVRMTQRDEVLLRLGRELVGADPLRVQGLLLDVTSAFLSSLEQTGAEAGAGARSPAEPLPPQRRLQEGITAYVLDPAAARLWRSEL
jgi:predicted dienelactone hydrolase